MLVSQPLIYLRSLRREVYLLLTEPLTNERDASECSRVVAREQNYLQSGNKFT